MLQNRYVYKTGTSFAVPLVSGGVALILTLVKDVNGNGRVNDEVMDVLANYEVEAANPSVIAQLNVASVITTLSRQD